MLAASAAAAPAAIASTPLQTSSPQPVASASLSATLLPPEPARRGWQRPGGSLRVRLLASSLVVAILLSGGFLLSRDSGESSQSLEAVTLAAAQTRAAGTAQMAMTMTFTGFPSPTGADSFTMNASGAMDFARNRGKMTMDMSSLVPAGMPGGGQVDMIFDDFVIYMQMPGIAQFAGGKSWLRFDAAAMAQQQGVDLQSLSQFGSSDPTQGLQYLAGVAGDVEVVGQEIIRGEQTTHYSAEVDLVQAAEQAPPEFRELAVESTKVVVDQLGTDTIPMEVWIDDAGLLRQIYYSMEMGGAEGMPDDAAISIMMQMYDFGSKVRIQLPPAFQVADIADLAGLTP